MTDNACSTNGPYKRDIWTHFRWAGRTSAWINLINYLDITIRKSRTDPMVHCLEHNERCLESERLTYKHRGLKANSNRWIHPHLIHAIGNKTAVDGNMPWKWKPVLNWGLWSSRKIPLRTGKRTAHLQSSLWRHLNDPLCKRCSEPWCKQKAELLLALYSRAEGCELEQVKTHLLKGAGWQPETVRFPGRSMMERPRAEWYTFRDRKPRC